MRISSTAQRSYRIAEQVFRGALRSLIANNIINVQEALDSLDKMRQSGRRLPWNEAEQILSAME
jgi:hypothetical protein